MLALQETNRLANLRIAMLDSLLADAPKAIAVSLWDNAKQEGVFVAQNLKPLPADRDYQLWVLDNGTTPVDAGVFHVDDHGGVRVEFKAKLPINVAGRFAVTEEAKGGVARRPSRIWCWPAIERPPTGKSNKMFFCAVKNPAGKVAWSAFRRQPMISETANAPKPSHRIKT